MLVKKMTIAVSTDGDHCLELIFTTAAFVPSVQMSTWLKKDKWVLSIIIKIVWPTSVPERVLGLPRDLWTTLWRPPLHAEFELNWPTPAVEVQCGTWIPGDLNQLNVGPVLVSIWPWASGSSKAESPSYPVFWARRSETWKGYESLGVNHTKHPLKGKGLLPLSSRT